MHLLTVVVVVMFNEDGVSAEFDVASVNDQNMAMTICYIVLT